MSDGPTRIALCGLGSIGKAAGRLLLDHRKGFELVGAMTLQPEAVGRPLHEVVGASTETGLLVADSIDRLLGANPDLIVLCTGSFLQVVRNEVDQIVAAGIDLVSPCEELAFPYTREPDYAADLDRRARQSGATVLGTGVNPGFIFDNFLLAASGSAWDVRSIRGRRVVDVSGFAQNIHLRLGIGYPLAEFEAGHQTGAIAGHVGFPESIQLVAERMGLALDGPVEESFEPLIAQTPVDTPYGGVPVGATEGFVQRAVGRVAGEAMIQLELLLHLRPHAAGFETNDTFSIDGKHPINVTLSPGMDAIPATSAQLVNSIPGVLRSAPGLKTVKDLPSATAWVDLQREVLR